MDRSIGGGGTPAGSRWQKQHRAVLAGRGFLPPGVSGDAERGRWASRCEGCRRCPSGAGGCRGQLWAEAEGHRAWGDWQQKLQRLRAQAGAVGRDHRQTATQRGPRREAGDAGLSLSQAEQNPEQRPQQRRPRGVGWPGRAGCSWERKDNPGEDGQEAGTGGKQRVKNRPFRPRR